MKSATKEGLYEVFGGEAGLACAVELFYSKVLRDDSINRFFFGVDLHALQRMQEAFLTLVLGGPRSYGGRSMRSAHAHLIAQGLNDTHFDAVVQHLVTTLLELGMAHDLVSKVAAIAESTRQDVLGRAPELFRKARGGE
jgi:hemoglobin